MACGDGLWQARHSSAAAAAGRGLPATRHARLVVLVHQLLDVGELLVEVLEAGVGLLAGRVRPRPLELVSDPRLHILQGGSVSQGAGCRVQGFGVVCRVQGAGCRVLV